MTKIRSVVLVDDRAEALGFLAAQFVRRACTVRTAMTPSEALTTLAKSPADLVLVDLVLGGDWGFDVVERIQKAKRSRIVALLTGQDTASTRAEADERGVEHVFFKPLLASAILGQIEDGIPACVRRPVALSALPVELVTRDHAMQALIAANGNLSLAARVLGISRQRLARSLERPLPRELRGLTIVTSDGDGCAPIDLVE